MKKSIELSFLVALAIFTFSCKSTVAPVASFTYVMQQDTAVFTNTTIGATSYSWDFGDKTTSTDKDPVHVYATSGSYTVTLTATNEGGTKTYSEVLSIAKPVIKIDGSFADWDALAANKLFTTTLPDTASLKAIKTLKITFDDNFIYFYVKLDSINVGSFDIYINSDNVATTGNNSWLWKGVCGADYLLDGLLSANLADDAVYNFPATATDQTAWAWVNTLPAGGGVITMSKPKIVSGTVVEFEGKIVKELVTSQWANKIGIGVFVQTPTWDLAGALPGGGGSNFSLLPVTLK
jgi:PKD repeat protein